MKTEAEARDMIHGFETPLLACYYFKESSGNGHMTHSAECDRLTAAAMDPFALVRLFDPPLRRPG